MPTTLKQAFAIRHGEVISLVGGGGKTTLMFALAQELASVGEPVLTTTTTKISEPLPSQTPRLLVERDEEKMLWLLIDVFSRYRHVTLASERMALGKLNGVSPELKESPGQARIVPLINKVDLSGTLPKARNLATEILAMKHPQLSRVVLGQAQLREPVLEVIET